MMQPHRNNKASAANTLDNTCLSTVKILIFFLFAGNTRGKYVTVKDSSELPTS